MCRWAAYVGPRIFLEEIVTAPCHSLITQSHNALEAKTPTNGDGFGIAWYGERNEPGLYRDILPAWSDPNLKSLCGQIRSGLFLAHVRASTGGATSRANCHPFSAGQWCFMHNGQIGGFERIRRALENSLSDTAYETIHGTTDSELFFALMLEEGLERDPKGAVERAAGRVIDASRQAGLTPLLRLTAAFSNGAALHAVRYATDDFAPTLYMCEFSKTGGRCIVSEPFDQEAPNWRSVPPSSFITITENAAHMHPFSPVTAPFAELAG